MKTLIKTLPIQGILIKKIEVGYKIIVKWEDDVYGSIDVSSTKKVIEEITYILRLKSKKRKK